MVCAAAPLSACASVRRCGVAFGLAAALLLGALCGMPAAAYAQPVPPTQSAANLTSPRDSSAAHSEPAPPALVPGATFSADIEVVTSVAQPVACTFAVLSAALPTQAGSVQVGNGSDTAISTLTSGYLHIPDTVQHNGLTYRVVKVGDKAFQGCNGLLTTGLVLNTTITALGVASYKECGSLQGTELAATRAPITTLGAECFSACYSLKGTELSPNKTITQVGAYAFSRCTSLIDPGLDGNNTVASLGEGTFAQCYNLPTTGLTTNTSITAIPPSCYFQCFGLVSTGLTVNHTVTTIGSDAFRECRNLISADFTANRAVKTVGERAFKDCTRILDTGLTLNGSVETLGDSSFEGCLSLASLTLPKTLHTLGTRVFADCRALRTIIILGEGPARIGSACFAASAPDAILYCEASQLARWEAYCAQSTPPISVLAYANPPAPQPDVSPTPPATSAGAGAHPGDGTAGAATAPQRLAATKDATPTATLLGLSGVLGLVCLGRLAYRAGWMGWSANCYTLPPINRK
ncbi:MAG: leucine-rich repeat protein [Raoultibacter sp.]